MLWAQCQNCHCAGCQAKTSSLSQFCPNTGEPLDPVVPPRGLELYLPKDPPQVIRCEAPDLASFLGDGVGYRSHTKPFAAEYDAAAGVLATPLQVCCVCFDAHDGTARRAVMQAARIPGYASLRKTFEPVICRGVLLVAVGPLLLGCDIRSRSPRFETLLSLEEGEGRFVGSLGIADDNKLLTVVVKGNSIQVRRVGIPMGCAPGQDQGCVVDCRGPWTDFQLLGEPFELPPHEFEPRSSGPSRVFFDRDLIVVPLSRSLLLGHIENDKVRWKLHEPDDGERTVRSVVSISGQMLRRTPDGEFTKVVIRAVTDAYGESTLCTEIESLDKINSWRARWGEVLTASEEMYGVDERQPPRLVQLTSYGVDTGRQIGFQRGSVHSIVRLEQGAGEWNLVCLTDGDAVRLRLYTSDRSRGQCDLGTGQPLTPPLSVGDKVFCCWAEADSAGSRGTEHLRGAWIPVVAQ